MGTAVEIAPETDRDLVLCRILDARPAQVYRAWTEADLLVRWFAPRPYRTSRAELDVRSGGRSLVVMQTPDGTEMPNRGVYLDVVENERLVFTDAFAEAWTPSDKPFMEVELTFAAENDGAQTRYTARVRHWSVADWEMHEQMGFHQGWSLCADQLEAVARTA